MASAIHRSDTHLNGLTALPYAVLQLADGSIFSGISFGAEDKSVAGECVFQTGEF
jgi:carbamoyl-phosphate synthase/aspartate carbamoyltransferase